MQLLFLQYHPELLLGQTFSSECPQRNFRSNDRFVQTINHQIKIILELKRLQNASQHFTRATAAIAMLCFTIWGFDKQHDTNRLTFPL